MVKQSYNEFIQPYIDAQQNILIRLEALNKDFRRKYKNYPIHNIQYRIKKKESIAGKLEQTGIPFSADNAKRNLMDIAGVRVICYFVEDVYDIVNMVKKQSDLIMMKERDYINKPKPNGYRSYHLVVGTTVYYTDVMEYYPVEIQFRTMSMDFWASMEHRICYKEGSLEHTNYSKELKEYSEMLKDIELNMEQHYDRKK